MPGASVNPLDPGLAIAWPIAIDAADRSLLSEKDAQLPMFHDR
jgi:dTDP-4-dehydrorhamnose 3,5-epimerase-like enzyme